MAQSWACMGLAESFSATALLAILRPLYRLIYQGITNGDEAYAIQHVYTSWRRARAHANRKSEEENEG